MANGRLLRVEDFESSVLREAAERLNLISLLACRYRAPELLRFLGALAHSLAHLEHQLRNRVPARAPADAYP